MLFSDYMIKKYNIKKEILEICEEAENEIQGQFKTIDNVAQFNTLKVLNSMQKNKLSDIHFASTTGYGYNDLGRDILEKIYADTFKTELALVRPQIISGTHALTVALFGNLKPGDELLSPVGKPYDTLEGVIGIRQTKNSLLEYGVKYKQVDLLEDGSIDYHNISKSITSKTKLVTIQRSKGYEWRHSFTVAEIGELIHFIKNINPTIICMVDNCYGEFVDTIEPSEVGADLCVGSLIKNPGGGLAPVGGYICGKKEFVENAADRLTAPGLGREVGPTLGVTSSLIQGFFLAPNVVSSSVKCATFAARIFEKLNIQVLPSSTEKRSDIVQAIKFNDKHKLINFCKGIQHAAPVDSYVCAEPAYMPGYEHDVIMAAGAFIQGSSIELSADAPIKEPYIAYLQGGLTWYHAKIGIIIGINNIKMSTPHHLKVMDL